MSQHEQGTPQHTHANATFGLSLLPILSKENSRLKHLKALLTQNSQRRKSMQTVLEGVHLLDAFARTDRLPDSIWVTAQSAEHAEVKALLQLFSQKKARLPVYVLADALYKELRTVGPGVDVMAIVDFDHTALPTEITEDTLILEGVQDAGNVGTMLRTAAAAGVKQIIAITGTAAIWSPRVLRAGMGAQFGLQIIEHVSMADVLPRLKLPLYVTSSYAAHSLYDLNLAAPCVWLMGNEGQGASEFALAHAQSVSIPQPGGQESLNVATAAAVCLYEMVRQRL